MSGVSGIQSHTAIQLHKQLEVSFDNVKYEGICSLGRLFMKAYDYLVRTEGEARGKLDMTQPNVQEKVVTIASKIFTSCKNQDPSLTAEQFLDEFAKVFDDKKCHYNEFMLGYIGSEFREILDPVIKKLDKGADSQEFISIEQELARSFDAFTDVIENDYETESSIAGMQVLMRSLDHIQNDIEKLQSDVKQTDENDSKWDSSALTRLQKVNEEYVSLRKEFTFYQNSLLDRAQSELSSREQDL